MRIYSIFQSIDGEVNRWGQGVQTVFVRTAGCSLACPYCDTKYAADPEGKNVKVMRPKEVAKIVRSMGTGKVTITGGEPLEQRRGTDALIDYLLYDSPRINVSLETNGAHELLFYGGGVNYIMDFKLHAEDKMCWSNFRRLNYQDFVKIVITGPEDYQRAKEVMRAAQDKFYCKARFAFSPVFSNGRPFGASDILRRLQKDGLHDVVLNVQLHKLMKLREDR